jgi:hypothetical protein
MFGTYLVSAHTKREIIHLKKVFYHRAGTLLQVMSIKAIGIAIKLTLEGSNQAGHFQTWVFVMVAVTCIVIQLNYLNKVSIL